MKIVSTKISQDYMILAQKAKYSHYLPSVLGRWMQSNIETNFCGDNKAGV